MTDLKEHHLNMIQHLIDRINLMYGIHRNDIKYKIFYKDGKLIVEDVNKKFNSIMRGGAAAECILIVSANEAGNDKHNPLYPIIGRQFERLNEEKNGTGVTIKATYKLKTEEQNNQTIELLIVDTSKPVNTIEIDDNKFTFYVENIDNIFDKNDDKTTIVNYTYTINPVPTTSGAPTEIKVNIVECYDKFNNSLDKFSKIINDCLTGNNPNFIPNPQYPAIPIAVLNRNNALLHSVSQENQDIIKLLEGISECISENFSKLHIENKKIDTSSTSNSDALKKEIDRIKDSYFEWSDNTPKGYEYIKKIIKCIKDKLKQIVDNTRFHIDKNGSTYTINFKDASILQDIENCIQTEIKNIGSPGAVAPGSPGDGPPVPPPGGDDDGKEKPEGEGDGKEKPEGEGDGKVKKPEGEGDGKEKPEGEGDGKEKPEGEGDGKVKKPEGEGDGKVKKPEGEGDGKEKPEGEGDGKEKPEGEGDGKEKPEGEGDGKVKKPEGEGDGKVKKPEGEGDGKVKKPEGEGDGKVKKPEGEGDGKEKPEGEGEGDGDDAASKKEKEGEDDDDAASKREVERQKVEDAQNDRMAELRKIELTKIHNIKLQKKQQQREKQELLVKETKDNSKHLSEPFINNPEPNSRKKVTRHGRYAPYGNIPKAEKEQYQKTKKGGASRGKKKIKQAENALYREKLREQNDYNDNFVKLRQIKEEEQELIKMISEINKKEKILSDEVDYYGKLLTQQEKDEIEKEIKRLYKEEIEKENKLKKIQAERSDAEVKDANATEGATEGAEGAEGATEGAEGAEGATVRAAEVTNTEEGTARAAEGADTKVAKDATARAAETEEGTDATARAADTDATDTDATERDAEERTARAADTDAEVTYPEYLYITIIKDNKKIIENQQFIMSKIKKDYPINVKYLYLSKVISINRYFLYITNDNKVILIYNITPLGAKKYIPKINLGEYTNSVSKFNLEQQENNITVKDENDNLINLIITKNPQIKIKAEGTNAAADTDAAEGATEGATEGTAERSNTTDIDAKAEGTDTETLKEKARLQSEQETSKQAVDQVVDQELGEHDNIDNMYEKTLSILEKTKNPNKIYTLTNTVYNILMNTTEQFILFFNRIDVDNMLSQDETNSYDDFKKKLTILNSVLELLNTYQDDNNNYNVYTNIIDDVIIQTSSKSKLDEIYTFLFKINNLKLLIKLILYCITNSYIPFTVTTSIKQEIEPLKKSVFPNETSFFDNEIARKYNYEWYKNGGGGANDCFIISIVTAYILKYSIIKSYNNIEIVNKISDIIRRKIISKNITIEYAFIINSIRLLINSNEEIKNMIQTLKNNYLQIKDYKMANNKYSCVVTNSSNHECIDQNLSLFISNKYKINIILIKYSRSEHIRKTIDIFETIQELPYILIYYEAGVHYEFVSVSEKDNPKNVYYFLPKDLTDYMIQFARNFWINIEKNTTEEIVERTNQYCIFKKDDKIKIKNEDAENLLITQLGMTNKWINCDNPTPPQLNTDDDTCSYYLCNDNNVNTCHNKNQSYYQLYKNTNPLFTSKEYNNLSYIANILKKQSKTKEENEILKELTKRKEEGLFNYIKFGNFLPSDFESIPSDEKSSPDELEKVVHQEPDVQPRLDEQARRDEQHLQEQINKEIYDELVHELTTSNNVTIFNFMTKLETEQKQAYFLLIDYLNNPNPNFSHFIDNIFTNYIKKPTTNVTSSHDNITQLDKTDNILDYFNGYFYKVNIQDNINDFITSLVIFVYTNNSTYDYEVKNEIASIFRYKILCYIFPKYIKDFGYTDLDANDIIQNINSYTEYLNDNTKKFIFKLFKLDCITISDKKSEIIINTSAKNKRYYFLFYNNDNTNPIYYSDTEVNITKFNKGNLFLSTDKYDMLINIISQIEYLKKVLNNEIPDVVSEIDVEIKKIITPSNNADTFTKLQSNYQSNFTTNIETPILPILTSHKTNCDIIIPTNVGTMDKYYKDNLQHFQEVTMQYQFIFVKDVDVFEIGNSVYSDNCIVQVASQYNFLESTTSNYSTVKGYFNDRSQGPYASLSCLSALFLRDYLFRPENKIQGKSMCPSQTIFDHFNTFNQTFDKTNSYIYRNGYLELFKLASDNDDGIEKINTYLDEEKMKKLNVLFQNGIPVYSTTNKPLTQVFTAAPSYQTSQEYDTNYLYKGNIIDAKTYIPNIGSSAFEICKKLMTAQYEAIAQFAVLKSLKSTKTVNLHLTLVGQGYYDNNQETLNESFNKVIEIVRDSNVRVFIHIFEGTFLKSQKPKLYQNLLQIFGNSGKMYKKTSPDIFITNDEFKDGILLDTPLYSFPEKIIINVLEGNNNYSGNYDKFQDRLIYKKQGSTKIISIRHNPNNTYTIYLKETISPSKSLKINDITFQSIFTKNHILNNKDNTESITLKIDIEPTEEIPVLPNVSSLPEIKTQEYTCPITEKRDDEIEEILNNIIGGNIFEKDTFLNAEIKSFLYIITKSYHELTEEEQDKYSIIINNILELLYEPYKPITSDTNYDVTIKDEFIKLLYKIVLSDVNKIMFPKKSNILEMFKKTPGIRGGPPKEYKDPQKYYEYLINKSIIVITLNDDLMQFYNKCENNHNKIFYSILLNSNDIIKLLNYFSLNTIFSKLKYVYNFLDVFFNNLLINLNTKEVDRSNTNINELLEQISKIYNNFKSKNSILNFTSVSNYYKILNKFTLNHLNIDFLTEQKYIYLNFIITYFNYDINKTKFLNNQRDNAETCSIFKPITIEDINKIYEKKSLPKTNHIDEDDQFIYVSELDAFLLSKSKFMNNSVIQVSSGYNFLQPKLDDNHYTSILDYVNMKKQGPQSSLSCLSSLYLRDYFFKPNPEDGNTGNIYQSQTIFSNSKIYENGYLEIFKLNPDEIIEYKNYITTNYTKLNILFQNSKPIYNDNNITQVFIASPSFEGDPNYKDHVNDELFNFVKKTRVFPPNEGDYFDICNTLITAQYEAISQFAVLKSLTSTDTVNLHLNLIGNGTDKTPTDTLKESFKKVKQIVKGKNVKVFIHIFSNFDKFDNFDLFISSVHDIIPYKNFIGKKLFLNNNITTLNKSNDRKEYIKSQASKITDVNCRSSVFNEHNISKCFTNGEFKTYSIYLHPDKNQSCKEDAHTKMQLLNDYNLTKKNLCESQGLDIDSVECLNVCKDNYHIKRDIYEDEEKDIMNDKIEEEHNNEEFEKEKKLEKFLSDYIHNDKKLSDLSEIPEELKPIKLVKKVHIEPKTENPLLQIEEEQENPTKTTLVKPPLSSATSESANPSTEVNIPKIINITFKTKIYKLKLYKLINEKVIYKRKNDTLIIEVLDNKIKIILGVNKSVNKDDFILIYYCELVNKDITNLLLFFNWIKDNPKNNQIMDYNYDMTNKENERNQTINILQSKGINIQTVINLNISIPNESIKEGGNNNSTKSKKKYTYKYMAKGRRKSRRSRRQRGGEFGASQWAPSLVGSTISEQETHLNGGILTAGPDIMDKTFKFQGGSKGGNIANVLAQGAVPATLFAANYMYSPGKAHHKRKSYKKKHSRKHKKTYRKFRLY